MSILDAMRREEAGSSFDDEVVVEEKDTGKDQVTGDNITACQKVFSKFSVLDIITMQNALKDMKAINDKELGKSAVELNKMQLLPQFKFFSGYSGFPGVDFSTIDVSALFAGFDFGALELKLDAGISALKTLSLADLGSAFTGNLAKANNVITKKSKELLESANKYANSIKFKSALEKLTPEDIASCPTLANIKKMMDNPDGVSSEVVEETKDSTDKVAKTYKNKVADMEKLSNVQKKIDEDSSFLSRQLVFIQDPKNQLRAEVSETAIENAKKHTNTARQKATSLPKGKIV